MNIYSCVDYKNIDKIIVLFNSCYINCSEKTLINFYIVTDSNDTNNLSIPKNLIDKIKIKKVNFDNYWNNLLNNFNSCFYENSSWCKNDMNFARFLFFKLFPEIKRAIYLDWDMIVQGNIYDLIDQYNSTENMIISKINNKSIYHNIFNNSLKGNIYSKNFVKINNVISSLDSDLKLLTTTPHFCAGFYIVSNFHFEEKYLQQLLQKLIDVQSKYKCFNFGTQSVMNLMHIDKRIFIDRLWNLTPDKHNIDEIKIIHWNGHSKPWNDHSKEINKKWWYYKNLIN